MSLHISVVSIEGNHLDEIAEVLRECQYVIEDSFIVKTGEEASRQLEWGPDRNHVAKVAYFANGWTHVVDPELVLMVNDVWIRYSQAWNNRILGWLCEGASGSYGITVFNAGRRVRQVLAVDGEVSGDEGDPLPEEANTDWSEAWEDDVLEIARRFGAEYDYLENRDYLVFHLDESQMSGPGLSDASKT